MFHPAESSDVSSESSSMDCGVVTCIKFCTRPMRRQLLRDGMGAR